MLGFCHFSSSEHTGYRFGFNGMEKDDEVKGNGNFMFTHYRGIDTRIGRWLSVDPKTKLAAWESPYLSMGANPIWRYDPMGDKWDDSNDSQEKADDFRTKTKTEIGKAESTLSSLTAQAENLGSGKAYDKVIEKIRNVQDHIGEMETSLLELNVLESSDQVYRLQPKSGLQGTTTYTMKDGKLYEEGGGGGRTYYENGIVVMEYAHGYLSTKAHELKHGFQFDRGMISFTTSTGKGGPLYDLTDEQAAYKRGSAFGLSVTKPLLSVTTKQLVGMGYTNKVHESLSIHTTLKEYYRILYNQDISGEKYSNLPVYKFENQLKEQIFKVK